MSESASPRIELSVPALPLYARPVRMFAASLASVASLGVDEVEDLRMAVEEGFVYACATGAEEVRISFSVSMPRIEVDFSLGALSVHAAADPAIEYSELLLQSLCDSFEVDEAAHVLRIAKAVGDAR